MVSVSNFKELENIDHTSSNLAEMGQLMTSFRDFETDKGWNWVRAKGPYVKTKVNDYLRFEDRGGGTYELVVLDGWHTKASISLRFSCISSYSGKGYEQSTRWIICFERFVCQTSHHPRCI